MQGKKFNPPVSTLRAFNTKNIHSVKVKFHSTKIKLFYINKSTEPVEVRWELLSHLVEFT